MPSVSLDGLRFPALAWPFKLVPGKHRTIRLHILETSSTRTIRPIQFKQNTEGEGENMERYVQQLTKTPYFAQSSSKFNYS